MSRTRRGWVMPVSLLLALILGMLPLPLELLPFRPYWVAIVLAYWVIETPDNAGLGLAFFVGVIADIAYGGLLGEQALRLVVFTFILQRFRARLRFYPVMQQALALTALLLNDRLVATAIHLLAGLPTLSWHYWWAPLLGVVLWPPVFLLMDALRQGKRN